MLAYNNLFPIKMIIPCLLAIAIVIFIIVPCLLAIATVIFISVPCLLAIAIVIFISRSVSYSRVN